MVTDIRRLDGVFLSVADATTVVRAITGLSRSLGIATTAEGVETLDQAACLRREGCTQLQGYLYGKPMPAEALPERQGSNGAVRLTGS